MGTDHNEIRFKLKQVELSNQELVELAYTVRSVVEAVAHSHLTFEEANCYSHTFYAIRERILPAIDPRYRENHFDVCDFYDQDLSKDRDRLELIPNQAKRWESLRKEIQGMVNAGFCFDQLQAEGFTFVCNKGRVIAHEPEPCEDIDCPF
jgi:hypothetical protein